jgi:Na+/H+ antiporter NhaD/arsenite permease-like protein
MMSHCYCLLFLKQKKKKHTHKKTKRRERAYLQALAPPFHFWLLFLPSRFCTFVSGIFSWHFFFSSIRKKKKTQRKKNHRKGQKCRKGRELTFKLSLCLRTFGSYFYPLAFALSFQALSLDIFFFSNRRKEKHK